MGRKSTAQKIEPKGPLQRALDREARAKAEEPLVSPFAAPHGDYREQTIPVTRGELEGVSGNIRVTRNRGGTTIERWEASGSLEPHQVRAMELYSTAWHTVHKPASTTMKWQQRIAFTRGGEEARIATLVDAEELLGLLDDRVFDIAPRYYFDTWQNVVLFDQAAGVAGGGNRSSAERAKTICLFIADMIATILRL